MTHPPFAGGMPASHQHPQHHPSPETLASYAAGTMRAGFDVVLSSHLRSCAICRREVERLEAVGGQLLSELDPAALSERALAETLARLDIPSAPATQPERGIDRLIESARRRWVAPGVWTAKIDTPHHSLDRVFLLKVAPGATTARHTHGGAEFTQVLEGALEDGDVIYRAGDFVELGEGHTHHPKVHGDEACLCLFATEGRLVPTDWMGRIAFAIANV